MRSREELRQAQQCFGIDRPLERAGLGLPQRNAEFAHQLAYQFCKCAAVVVELALRSDPLPHWRRAKKTAPFGASIAAANGRLCGCFDLALRISGSSGSLGARFTLWQGRYFGS